MAMIYQSGKRGYTVVELMVTIAIVTVLAATVGTFVVRLLTFQETWVLYPYRIRLLSTGCSKAFSASACIETVEGVAHTIALQRRAAESERKVFFIAFWIDFG